MSEAEMRDLEASFLASVEAHKTHRASLRHDPDDIWRCPECDPVPPRRCACGDVWPDASYGCGHTPTLCEGSEGYGLFDPYAFTSDSTTSWTEETPVTADPSAVARPTVCPCGHPVGDEYLCIEGRIYGPCGDENCGGVCEDTHGYCTSDDCACEEDE